jgi:putative NIF3 family GTP cyclohydrolase 1 type 2
VHQCVITLRERTGHHATERFGPRALAATLRSSGLDARFIDIDNPA